MKKLILPVILSSIPSVVLAESACGYLHISIQNYTGGVCKLQAANVMSGSLVSGQVPKLIYNGEMSSSFQMQQGYFSGPAIQLIYNCKNKSISLTSKQNLCFLAAGGITGDVNTANNLHARYLPYEGSYWSSKPGAIVWTIV
ncbi:hypothetical protein [Legionella impletisoli]|uniref:Fimbrial protein n=1 Tax=Legionella impletisoli TaxID=343510 RepID=A0A917N8H1_9GAMM|nr:hypothetical protein [Legionella impletisoli]GGI77787.1 hypothetical protein GCM10007966_03030 [Legionella impletisoli]